VTHPLRGEIFESWVASEVFKARTHRRLEARLSHLRVSRGLEVDLLVDTGGSLIAAEMKSGATPKGKFFKQLDALADELEATNIEKRVVFGGDQRQRRSAGELLPWSAIHEVDWW